MRTIRSYTFDRRADPKRATGLSYTPPTHNEARLVVTERTAQNTVLPEVGQVITRWQPRRNVQTSLFDGRRWANWLGTAIGQGAYGVAFRCQVNSPAVYNALELVRAASTFWVEYRPVKVGTQVVVKVTRDESRSPTGGVGQGTLDEFALENIKEATLHKHLDEARCLNLWGMAPLCVSKYVPDLYWAGLVVNQATGRRCYVTVMGVAPGIPVGKFLSGKRSLDAETFLRIERAAAALWSQGVVHADLHKDNMMYDAATKKLTIIDFGFGVLLPPDYTAALRLQLNKAVRDGVRSLGELWTSTAALGIGIQNYVNRVQRGRGVPWYNPDGHAAMMLYKRLPPSERLKVAAMRRNLWGVKLTASPASSASSRSSRSSRSLGSSRSFRSYQTPRSSPSSKRRLPVAARAAAALTRRSWWPRLRIPFAWRRRRTPVMVYPSP